MGREAVTCRLPLMNSAKGKYSSLMLIYKSCDLSKLDDVVRSAQPNPQEFIVSDVLVRVRAIPIALLGVKGWMGVWSIYRSR